MTKEQKILSLLAQFEDLGIDKQIDYEKFYLYSLITHSTAIEGSTVTEIENQLLFDEGISAKGRSMNEQLMNLDLKAAYEKSISYAKSGSDITIDMLKKLASVVMYNTGAQYNTALGEFSSSKGDLRLLNVTAGVGGRSYMNYTKVPQALAEFCREINVRRKTLLKSNILACYRLSFDAHFQLVTIHPWADGNGRMSRLFMNQLQFEFGVIPTIIHKQTKAEYIEALVSTRETNNIEIFRDFMFDEHIRNLETLISNYKNSIEGTNVPVNVPVNVPIELSDREELILQLMINNPSITIVEISQRLEVNERTIRRAITSLKTKKVLQRTGSDKNGKWVVI